MRKLSSVPVYGHGTLVNLETQWRLYREKASSLPKIRLSPLEYFDLFLLGIGAYSPLTGFMTQADYQSVLTHQTLHHGLTWPIPITLATSPEKAKSLHLGQELLLVDAQDLPIGVLELQEIYSHPKLFEAKQVFKTEDPTHPGVSVLLNRPSTYLAGPVRVFTEQMTFEGKQHFATPQEVRTLFQNRHWQTVVAFQTRNPIHRAHEYLQKCALEQVDGLLIHPLVGETKSDDIPAKVRIQCYEELIKNYYVSEKTVFRVYPAAMRYAGPNEAILHAIVRQNYGCSHIIIGRDHAGVGSFYGPYDAQNSFLTLPAHDLQITPIFFENTFYCQRCGQMGSIKTCPHPKEAHLHLSGTKVRALLEAGEPIPEEFTRPEIAQILKTYYSNEAAEKGSEGDEHTEKGLKI